MMIQGTTPTHIFELPFDVDLISVVKVVYAQMDEILIEKNTEDCVLSRNTITTKLTQEETFKFKNGLPVQIQLRVMTTEGEALVSRIENVSVSKCLDKEVFK